MKRLPRFLLYVGFAGVLLALPGCDSLEGIGESVILTKEATFTFEFSTASPQASRQVASSNRVDLSGNLDGFSKGEILSATVEAAELRRVQPVGQDLSDLAESIELHLEAGGASTTVARLTSLPADNEADLSLTSTRTVTSQVTANNFGAQLALTNLAANTYRLEVRVRLRIEVEGV